MHCMLSRCSACLNDSLDTFVVPLVMVSYGSVVDCAGVYESARSSAADGISEAVESRLSGMVLCSQSSPRLGTFHAF